MYERNIPGNIQRIKFQSSCKHMQPSCPATTLNVTNQDLYPNIYAIFTVLIMPVSSASSERSFSAILRVKRLSTMGDERLYINCVYVLELPTLEPLFMSLLVFIVSIGVVLDI
jgi:hypothetical protein